MQAQRTMAKKGSVPHTSHSASFSSGTSSGASVTLRCRSHLRKCSCSWGGKVLYVSNQVRVSTCSAHLGRNRDLGMHNMQSMRGNPQQLRTEHVRSGEERA